MTRHILKQLDRYRFVIAPLIVLCCGGGCMMSFQPQHPVAMQQLGVDDHTRARVEGQADPRPSDPQPHAGLSGTLVIAEVGHFPKWASHHGYSIQEAPGPNGHDLRTMFYIHDASIKPSVSRQAAELEGVSDVCILPSRPTNSQDPFGEQPMTRDTLLQAARDAGGDLLLVYTASTDADATDVTLSIGAILTLGFGPTVVVSGEAEVQAVLMDAHTGYVYALAQAEGDSLGISGAWRRESEKMSEADDAVAEAVGELIDRLEAAWPAMRRAYP